MFEIVDGWLFGIWVAKVCMFCLLKEMWKLHARLHHVQGDVIPHQNVALKITHPSFVEGSVTWRELGENNCEVRFVVASSCYNRSKNCVWILWSFSICTFPKQLMWSIHDALYILWYKKYSTCEALEGLNVRIRGEIVLVRPFPALCVPSELLHIVHFWVTPISFYSS